MTRHLLGVVLAAALLFAAKHANLSGKWELDIAASQFAKQGPPQSKLTRIVHKEPKLEITIEEVDASGKKLVGTSKYTTDGKMATNDVLGNPMQAMTGWEGDVLVMETTGTFGTNKIKLVDRYELSNDRKTLTVKRHFEGQRGGVQDQVLVMRKK